MVAIDFPDVESIKRRPAIVVSSSIYHRHRPDIIVGVVTSQTQKATALTDYVMKDWAEAGLHRPSAFRTFWATLAATVSTPIGHCSERDWRGIITSLEKAIAGLHEPSV